MESQGELFGSSRETRRARNLPFEALAEETGTDWKTGRGELNKALSLIRQQTDGQTDVELAREIHVRAALYRMLMPSAILTAPALAKHWLRVRKETQPPSLRPAEPCPTCDDLKLVLVETRVDGSEAYGQCPDCVKKI